MTQNANNPSNTSSGQQSHGDSTTTPPANVATSASHGDQSSTTGPTAEELARKLAEVMEENAEYRKKARERKAAEEQHLKEQGEFKALAEEREAKIRELEPRVKELEHIAERHAQLSGQIKTKIKADVKDWPAEIMAFYPGDDAPVEQLNAWYDRSQPLLEKLQVQARGTQPGNSPNPRPQTQTPEGAHDEYLKRLRASGKYGA